MRVVHLTPEPPSLEGTGGAARQFHLLRRLEELGHEVTVVAPERPASRVAEGMQAFVKRPLLLPEIVSMPVLAWQAQVFWASLRPRALRMVEEKRPDVIAVEHDHAAAWRGDLPREIPAVLTLHNVGPAYYRRRGLRLEAARFERHDRRTLPLYDRLVAVSEQDAAEARRLADVPVDVVPNGARLQAPTPEVDGPPTLLFTGTMSHPPNAEGIVWFAREVWPHVPDARLLVVGRDPPESVRRLASDRIEVTGVVADVRPYFARATAVVVPLLSGGGTRMKILEAFAAGRAVVSTSIGAEGLEVSPGKHLLIADGAAAFGEKTRQLVDDGELRTALAAEARTLVEERYDWCALGDRLEETLRRAAERG
jgi:polysaccharide biosynthesis protein PslH